MSRRARLVLAVLTVALLSAATAGSALGAFPYNRSIGSTSDYKDFFLTDETPTDLTGKLEWMYAATAEPGYGGDTFGTDLDGIRGAHVGDATDAPPTAWETTLGRPDVSISVLDSGIKWDDDGAMNNLRFKTWINFGEVPTPNVGRNDGGSTTESLLGTDCAGFTATDDANGDSVLNIRDFACDTRVQIGAPRNVNPDLFEPQDILIAFTGGDFGGDDDGNGFVDDMVGWDFLDDDNDPYDDVQYGHGTGEAQDSTAEANNGGELGTCPNCMSMQMRVGDSFVADVNRFAQATIYGVDNGALVIQEALGTLNNTRLARQAVNYAYNHGVTVIASAADEAAQHNNWPSSLPNVILVNSVTQYDEVLSPQPESYLQFTGCTNFNSKVTLSIPSVSCSSDATGRASGMAGLIYSAALNASERSKLDDHPTCTRAVDGPDAGTALDPCLISANEVRQLMATGIIDGTPQADDVDFLPIETSCGALPTPGCTDPYKPDVIAELETTRTVVSPLAESRAYPARGGHDQFYGYGRVNMENAVSAVVRPPLGDANVDALLPPEVEITSPEWFDQIDPDAATFDVEGKVRARSNTTGCTYRVLLAPGHYPNNSEAPTGDFQEVDSGPCTSPVDGVLATVDIDDLQARFPASVMFDSQQPTPTPLVENGRPFNAPNGFTIKVTATATQTALPTPASVTGQDHRTAWLHRDQDLLDGFPRKLMGNSQTGDGASSPALADLDGDNDNELIVAGSDGFVHAFRRDGSELSGWPVRTDQPALHTGGRAFTSGGVGSNLGGAVLASVAVGDSDRDGIPEVYAADFEGKVYGWNPSGNRVFQEESNLAYGGKPLTPFQNSRIGKTNRTQHGFIGSPVLADIDGNDGGRLEIVAASMDRHLYAWNGNGSDVPGYPLLVVDPSKVASINPTTHQVTFNGDSGSEQQGAIVDTPAIGDLDADANETGADELPEIVVGTNEEYAAAQDGGVNADTANSAAFTLLEQAGVLSPGNTRLYAINATGDPNADPSPAGAFRDGWPAKVGLALTELLPIVGEGVTGSPVIGPVTCAHGGAGPKVGTIPGAGFGYIFAPDGVSCYDRENGKDRALSANFTGAPGKYDTPVLAAVGHPAFGSLLPGVSPTFLAPAAGAIRAVDLGANEYQGGQDFVMGWNSETSAPQAGFPVAVNDLQFLTGPSVANIDATPAEEIVAGTASADLVALTAAGAPVPGWPKLTGDWTVANPTVGSFGTVDAGPGASSEGKAVIGLTRSGYILAYDTEAGACTAGSWPRFHHDNANSGNFERDAVLPGKPVNPGLGGNPAVTMFFNAPGDDLMCGTVDHYEVVTDGDPIDESTFDAATALDGEPDPVAPGALQSFPIPENAERYLAVRAVDEQGNVGRTVGFDRGAPPIGDSDNDGDLDDADNCPDDFNPDQSDQDGDSVGDACDPDRDGDGVADSTDNCELDANPDQADNDNDGLGNVCDPTPGPLPGGGDTPAPSGACATEKRGTGGRDTLTGTDGGDRLVGLKGNDNIKGLGGDDCLFGNKGSDRVNGGSGADQLSGGNKRDRLVGGPGIDVIRAGNAGDVIKARDGEADIVDCGGGVDRVKADKRDKLTNCEAPAKRSKKRRG